MTLIQDLILTRFGVEYTTFIAKENEGLAFTGLLEHGGPRLSESCLVFWGDVRQVVGDGAGLLIRVAQSLEQLRLIMRAIVQWGSLSYTWVSRGQQPKVRISGRQRGYKVFGLIEYFSGAFYYRAHSDKFTGDNYIALLTDVLARTKDKPVFLLQDGARYHTSKAVKAFFQAHTDHLTVYQLPRYSPEFNPIEFLWRNVKKQATHLRYFPTFADLTAKADSKLQYFADLPESIKDLMERYCETLGETIT